MSVCKPENMACKYSLLRVCVCVWARDMNQTCMNPKGLQNHNGLDEFIVVAVVPIKIHFLPQKSYAWLCTCIKGCWPTRRPPAVFVCCLHPASWGAGISHPAFNNKSINAMILRWQGSTNHRSLLRPLVPPKFNFKGRWLGTWKPSALIDPLKCTISFPQYRCTAEKNI